MIHFDNQDINSEGTALFAGPVSCIDCFRYRQGMAIANAGTAVGVVDDHDELRMRVAGNWDETVTLECEECFDEFARGVAA